MSVSGCKKALAIDYCNAGDSGPQVGQVASITLAPQLATTGESLSFGQIGQSLSASAIDCKNNAVALAKFTYATTNMAIADINPNTGSVCAGTWNRNSGGGISDYSTCTAPSPLPTLSNTGTPVAYVHSQRQRRSQQFHPGLHSSHRHQHRSGQSHRLELLRQLCDG